MDALIIRLLIPEAGKDVINLKRNNKMKNTKFNKRRIIQRLIALPFVFSIMLIAHNMFVLKRMWYYILYGGEYVNFEENERDSVLEIYKMLKEIRENQKQEEQK